MDWMFVFPANLGVETPNLNIILFGDMDCEEVIKVKRGNKSGVQSEVVGALEEEEQAPELSLSAMWGHRKKVAFGKPGREFSPETELAGTLILGFSASRTVRQ